MCVGNTPEEHLPLKINSKKVFPQSWREWQTNFLKKPKCLNARRDSIKEEHKKCFYKKFKIEAIKENLKRGLTEFRAVSLTIFRLLLLFPSSFCCPDMTIFPFPFMFAFSVIFHCRKGILILKWLKVNTSRNNHASYLVFSLA